SGKSTLLHLIAGLDRPTSGTVRWSDSEARRTPAPVGVIFQGPSLVPWLDAQENVALPLLLRGMAHERAQDAALAGMRRVGIHALANQLPDELSGGQAQRVAVSRALAMRPVLILADEPTGQLDGEAGRAVIDLLMAVADEAEAGLVVATHDPRISARMA